MIKKFINKVFTGSVILFTVLIMNIKSIIKNICLGVAVVFTLLLVTGMIPTNHQVQCKLHPEYTYCN